MSHRTSHGRHAGEGVSQQRMAMLQRNVLVVGIIVAASIAAFQLLSHGDGAPEAVPTLAPVSGSSCSELKRAWVAYSNQEMAAFQQAAKRAAAFAERALERSG